MKNADRSQRCDRSRARAVEVSRSSTGAAPGAGWRGRCQFSVRLLLVLITATAVALGLLSESARRQAASAAAIERLQGEYTYRSWHKAPNGEDRAQRVRGGRPQPGSVLYNLFHTILAIDLSGTPCTDSDLRLLRGVPRLERLYLDATRVGDGGSQWITKLRRMQCLSIIGTRTSDAGTGFLFDMPQLSELYLGGQPRDRAEGQITDVSLAAVANCSRLRVLRLEGPGFTDGVIRHLVSLKSLESLYLVGTRVTARGVATLQRALPRCEVVSGEG